MRIIVFEQNGSARKKIFGIHRHGRDMEISQIISINGSLPTIIDNPEHYLPTDFSADLALNFLLHPDLSRYLVSLCVVKKIPVVAAGKKEINGAFTPFTCCGLEYNKVLGIYGELFGIPEYEVTLEDDRIIDIKVVRGAPCGATWSTAERARGRNVDEALSLLSREVQCLCGAKRSESDPVSGKSPLQYAGHVHQVALKKAIGEARKKSG